MSDPLHLVLDANLFLHYQRPDQVDWPAIVGRSSVVLVITPTLLRELEHLKVRHPVRKLRERARRAVAWLSTFIENEGATQIRAGVSLTFVRKSPTIDFASHDLSRDISDDHLIASTLEYQESNAVDLAILSADTPLRSKLPAHGLRAVIPPEDICLPDEPDELERENAALKQQLARHTDRMPDLRLKFHDGSTRFELSNLRESVQQQQPEEQHGGMNSFFSGYLIRFETWRQKALLATPFAVRLENSGTGTATDLRIEFRDFPDFIEVFDRGDPPRLRGGLFDTKGRSDERDPKYEKHNVAAFQIASLVHTRTFESHLIWLHFRDESSVRNFSCRYRITCREALEPVDGALHFSVEEHWTPKDRSKVTV